MDTLFIPAYDVEAPGACLEACRSIARIHKHLDAPATFFVVGKRLEEEGTGLREVLDDPLFEIGSHTYSHKMLRDHPFCGPAAPPGVIHDEIFKGHQLVEEVFERPCLGLRPG